MSSHLLSAENNTHPVWWKDSGLRVLNWHCFILQLGIVVYGYDGSLMNGFFTIQNFLDDMQDPSPNVQGLLIAAISIGAIIGTIICPHWSDVRGRKEPQMVGSAIIIIGVLVQILAISPWKFFGSRIIIGTGSAMVMTISSVHVIELAHPRQAAQQSALFSSNWFVGAIIAAWATFGSLWITSNWDWRLPCLIQAGISLVNIVGLIFVPESPRYLVQVGRIEEAHDILAKYHANGDREDPMVLLEIAEIQEGIRISQEVKSSSIAYMFSTPGNRKRLVISVFVGLAIQWAGNGIISYYFTPILASVGITSTVQSQGINGGLQIWSYLFALLASFNVNRFKRRTLWLTSFGGMLVCYTIFTALTGVYATKGNAAAGKACIPFLFLFNAFYSLAGTALCYLYVLEIAPQQMRAKLMALNLVMTNAGIFFNQYVNPVAFTALGWKYFIIYIVALLFSTTFIYFYFPETGGLTIEEAALICDGKMEELSATVHDLNVEKADSTGYSKKSDL